MKFTTKRFYNIGAHPSISKREGDNEAPSPINKAWHLVQHLLLSLNLLLSGERIW
ncbi:MAG: hypothetical protein QXP86_05825 [Nitrososphaerota archaeon]